VAQAAGTMATKASSTRPKALAETNLFNMPTFCGSNSKPS
jgi:hypothetical protein